MSSGAAWLKSKLGKSPKKAIRETELRVQKAMKRFDVQDWHLNRELSSPKVVKNETPMDYRQPASKQEKKEEKKQEKKRQEEAPQGLMVHQTRRPENATDPIRIYGMSKTSEPISLVELLRCRQQIKEEVYGNGHSIRRSPGVDLSKIRINLSDEYDVDTSFQDETDEETMHHNGNATYTKVSPSQRMQNINIGINRVSPIFYETSTNGSRNGAELNFSVVSPKPLCKKFRTPYKSPASEFQAGKKFAEGPSPIPFATSTLAKPSPVREASPVKEKFALNLFSNSPVNETLVSFASDEANNGSMIGNDRRDWMNSTYLIGEEDRIGKDRKKPCDKCRAKIAKLYAGLKSPNNSPQEMKNGNHIRIPIKELVKKEEIKPEFKSQWGIQNYSEEKEITRNNDVTESDDSSSENFTSSKNLTSNAITGSDASSSGTTSSGTTSSGTTSSGTTSSDKSSESDVQLDFPSSSSSSYIPVFHMEPKIGGKEIHWISIQPDLLEFGSLELECQEDENQKESPVTKTISKRTKSRNNESPSTSVSPVSIDNPLDKIPQLPKRGNCHEIERKHIELMRKVLRIDKRGVLDSGYSDRSQKDASPILNRTWVEKSDSTETETEITFSVRDRLRKRKA